MVLAGFNHGALMTAIYPGTEFKARVIISWTVSYTHLRAHETRHDLVCRLLSLFFRRQRQMCLRDSDGACGFQPRGVDDCDLSWHRVQGSGDHFLDLQLSLSLIHISEPTRLGMISYAVF